MKKPYKPPGITEVKLDHMINLTGGCKTSSQKGSTGGTKRCIASSPCLSTQGTS